MESFGSLWKWEAKKIAYTLRHWILFKSTVIVILILSRGELSYLAPLASENISAPNFKQCFFQEGEGGITSQTVKHHASQSQERNNKYSILYIEFCINNKI